MRPDFQLLSVYFCDLGKVPYYDCNDDITLENDYINTCPEHIVSVESYTFCNVILAWDKSEVIFPSTIPQTFDRNTGVKINAWFCISC